MGKDVGDSELSADNSSLLGGVLTLVNSHTLPLLHIPVLGGSISVLPEHNSNASGIMGFDCVGGWPGVWTPPR